MRQRSAKLLATRLALRLFQLAHDATPRELQPLALLLLLDLFRALLGLLAQVARGLGVLPLLLNGFALESPSHCHLIAKSHNRAPRSSTAGRSSATSKRSRTSASAASVKRPKYSSRVW